ncbi:MAG: hypothetical protein J6V07_01705 [Clostridia bacterium]|nr:hypothetical protein [Clostridia bacterium]
MTVTFFGHRDTPDSIRQKLREVLICLIEKEGARHFYVGNEGAYDRICQAVLAELQKQYSLDYTVVFAYMPTHQSHGEGPPTLLPEAAALAPPRFAIERRNAWLVSQSDLAVTYVISSYGGAAKAKGRMQKAGKRIIELSR